MDSREKLKNAGYKLTNQRLAIIEIFEQSDGHFTSEEIYDLVREKNEDLGLATVYRTMQIFEDLNIISSVDVGDGKLRYELYIDDGNHNHHHLICTDCGGIEEFEGDLLDDLEEIIAKKHSFEIHDHKLKFYGKCKNCQG